VFSPPYGLWPRPVYFRGKDAPIDNYTHFAHFFKGLIVTFYGQTGIKTVLRRENRRF
jgi:hypothetical protein